MSTSDPIQNVQNSASYFLNTPEDIDPHMLMMIASLMQVNAVHEAAKAKIGNLDNVFPTIAKLAPLPHKLTAAADQIAQTESGNTDTQIGDINQFQANYVANTATNSADDQKFDAIQQWANERGIPLENVHKTIQVEVEYEVTVKDPDSGELTTETRTRTEDRVVYDTAAIQRNEDKLVAYKNELAQGTADNSVLRNAIAAHPDVVGASGTLDELEHPLPLNTLSDLSAAATNVEGWTKSIVDTVLRHLQNAQIIHDELTRLLHESDHSLEDVQEFRSKEMAHDRHVQLMQAIQTMQINQRSLIPGLKDGLGRAIEETRGFLQDVADVTDWMEV